MVQEAWAERVLPGPLNIPTAVPVATVAGAERSVKGGAAAMGDAAAMPTHIQMAVAATAVLGDRVLPPRTV
ncbi:hypothetical protein BST10_03545 [Mycolicibacter algericus DSM 45454]|nr:hypothetical protein BST10_03545 [Mycolicibacter algericus DSM 45454]